MTPWAGPAVISKRNGSDSKSVPARVMDSAVSCGVVTACGRATGAALAAIALEKREVSPVEIRVAVAVTAAWSPGGMAPLNTKGAWPDASVVTVCEPSRTLPAARSTSPSGSLGVEKYSMRMLSLATLSSVPDRPSGVTVSSTGSAGSPLARLVRAMPPSVLP